MQIAHRTGVNVYTKIKTQYALNSIDNVADNDIESLKVNIEEDAIYFPNNFEVKLDDFLFHLKLTIANYKNLLN